MRKPGATSWDLVGNFTASESEIAALREVLEGQEPYDVLDKINHVLMRDVQNAVKAEGCQARVRFHEDH